MFYKKYFKLSTIRKNSIRLILGIILVFQSVFSTAQKDSLYQDNKIKVLIITVPDFDTTVTIREAQEKFRISQTDPKTGVMNMPLFIDFKTSHNLKFISQSSEYSSDLIEGFKIQANYLNFILTVRIENLENKAIHSFLIKKGQRISIRNLNRDFDMDLKIFNQNKDDTNFLVMESKKAVENSKDESSNKSNKKQKNKF